MLLADVGQGRHREAEEKERGECEKGKRGEKTKHCCDHRKVLYTNDIFLDCFHKFPLPAGYLAF